MRRAGPKPGVLIAADPATVERSGFTIRESRCFRTVRIRGSGTHRPNRKSHWSGITISRGRTPLLSTNRPPLRDACRLRSSNLAQTSGKARWARSSLWGRGAVSQETCHPQEPHLSEGLARSRERYSRCQHGGCHGFIIPFPERPVLHCRAFSLAWSIGLPTSRRALRPGPFHDIETIRQHAGSRRRSFRQIHFR